MTEGDRICPYCIKPMIARDQRFYSDWSLFHCDPCNIDVQIREIERIRKIVPSEGQQVMTEIIAYQSE